MPAVTSGKILVTGANGYLGAWTVKSLLDAGFSVRGTIRNESKAAHLKKTLAEHADRLEFAVVPDITKEGAFDEAIIGVDAVIHTASPIGIAAEDPQEHIGPAVEGTLGILRSANASLSVKRVVVVSSGVTAVNSYATTPREYNETHWNDVDVQIVEKEGRAASVYAKYRASKVIAERSAWAFYEQEKEKAKAEGKDLHWDLTVVNPPWLFSPVLHETNGPESLGISNKVLHDAILLGVYDTLDSIWMDGRDTAHALVQAVIKPGAGGQRILIDGGSFRIQDFILAAYRLSGGKTKPLEGEYDSNAPYLVRQDLTKAKEILGIRSRSIEDTTRDILREYETRGWL